MMFAYRHQKKLAQLPNYSLSREELHQAWLNTAQKQKQKPKQLLFLIFAIQKFLQLIEKKNNRKKQQSLHPKWRANPNTASQ